MKQPSQPDKTISKEELSRLARQWVELIFNQLQQQKAVKNLGTDNTPCQLTKND